MHRFVVSFGSNLEAEAHRTLARGALMARFGAVAESPFVWTEAIGGGDQPRYLNGAYCFHAGLDPERVRSELRAIEGELGRVRTADKYAPRTVDLDLIAVDGEIVHPDYHQRDFVRKSARSLAPDLP
ncbi:MAG: 2-amino-4-hydroxy-6-hydroxymethyldihydropteridine diphosphokinase [Spirochaetes bacterium]|nr:2-amino-4-hydroxy-6-hydroxymethyldihydropteridine diphosphokinase [Spirochaetota bacterium]